MESYKQSSFFTCGFCGVKYSNEKRFLEHVQEHHQCKRKLSTRNLSLRTTESSTISRHDTDVETSVELPVETNEPELDVESGQLEPFTGANQAVAVSSVNTDILCAKMIPQIEEGSARSNVPLPERAVSGIVPNTKKYKRRFGSSCMAEDTVSSAIVSKTLSNNGKLKVIRRIYHCSFCSSKFVDSERFTIHLQKHVQSSEKLGQKSSSKESVKPRHKRGVIQHVQNTCKTRVSVWGVSLLFTHKELLQETLEYPPP